MGTRRPMGETGGRRQGCPDMPSFIAGRLIQHTKNLMESEEKLCVKVLRTLQQMLLKKTKYGDRVSTQQATHQAGPARSSRA